MCSATPSIQPRASARDPAKHSGGATPRAAAAASASRSRTNRWRANGKLHHGTSSIRRSTASSSPPSAKKWPRSTVENISRLSTTPLRQRPSISGGSAMGRLSGTALLRRQRVLAGAPAGKIGKRPLRHSALLGQNLGCSAQAGAVSGPARRLCERWEQPEIDVHRLIGTRPRIDSLDVAAGNVIDESTMRGGGRWNKDCSAQALSGGETARQQPDGSGFHIAFAAGDLAGESQTGIRPKAQLLIQELRGVEKCVAV